MNLPFIKYIEALLACKYSFKQIDDKLKSLNVALCDIIPEQAYAEIYTKLAETNPTYFKQHDTLPEYEWLQEYEIDKMVASELNLQLPEGINGIKGAMEILNDPEMYRTMSALALAKVTDEDIELIVNGKYNIHYEMSDIKEFLHYFFNVEDWSLSEKKEYVRMVKVHKLQHSYQIALEGDKDYLIWTLGISPTRSFSEMLQEMGTDAFYFFKQKGKINAEEALKWGTFMTRVVERAERLDKDTKEKTDLFDEIEFVIKGKKTKQAKIDHDQEESLKQPFEINSGDDSYEIIEGSVDKMPHLDDLIREAKTDE